MAKIIVKKWSDHTLFSHIKHESLKERSISNGSNLLDCFW